ncbi:hypothetical protein KSP39_PZI012497 [Platanthera zijinensis]|uniref:Transposase n=1 Tax=Platanthera zijinensis TaxID=2320716 RepID=A0AAP0G4D6_9ASPA
MSQECNNVDESLNDKVKRNKRCPSMLIDEFVEVHGVSHEGGNLNVSVKVNQIQGQSSGIIESLQVDKDSQEGIVAQPNKEDGLAIKITRGKTMCKNIHARTLEDREEVTINEEGQPVGPTDSVVSDLSLFLGTLARNSTFCPLIYTSWKVMPNENIERVWNYTKSKFILPDEANNWVKITVRDAWRRYKHIIKKNHFLKYSNMTDRLKNRPVKVPEAQFKKLCHFWSLENIKSISERNTQSTTIQKWRHRMGPKTFAVVREKMRLKEKKDPTQAEIFIETRKGSKGKELDLETNNAISQLQDHIMNNEETNAEAFQAVFGKEHPGSMRCFGKGVTQTSLKQKEEIVALRKIHSEEVLLLNKKMHNMENSLNKLKGVLKTMLQQSNPAGIDIESLEDMLGSSPGDANSAQKVVCAPRAHSSI